MLQICGRRFFRHDGFRRLKGIIVQLRVQDVYKRQVQNGVYDELFITKNPDQPTEPTAEKEWDYDTILYAKFDGTTTAGNIQYTVCLLYTSRCV